MDKDHIIETLHGYQAGKINQYGFGSMMKGQAKKLSEDQLEAVALYVQSLEKKDENSEYKKDKTKKITQEEVEYNKFLKEHFDKSTNPNETYEEGKRRWAAEKKKKEAEAKEKKEAAENLKPKANAGEVNLDEIETAGQEVEEESSWFSNLFK